MRCWTPISVPATRPPATRASTPASPSSWPSPSPSCCAISTGHGVWGGLTDEDHRWVRLTWTAGSGGAFVVGVTVVASEAVRLWLKVAFTKLEGMKDTFSHL